MKKFIIPLLVAVGTLVIGSFAFASGNFLTMVAKFAGVEVANKLESNGELRPDFTSIDGVLGAGAHSQSSKQAKTQSWTSQTATSSISNPESATIILDKVFFFAQGNGSPATTAIHMAISNDGTLASTDLTVSSTFAGGSAYSYASTSTWPTALSRILTSTQSVICYTESGTTPSTTLGACGIEYYKP